MFQKTEAGGPFLVWKFKWGLGRNDATAPSPPTPPPPPPPPPKKKKNTHTQIGYAPALN